MKYYLKSTKLTPLTHIERGWQEVTREEYLTAQKLAGYDYDEVGLKVKFSNGKELYGEVIMVEQIPTSVIGGFKA